MSCGRVADKFAAVVAAHVAAGDDAGVAGQQRGAATAPSDLEFGRGQAGAARRTLRARRSDLRGRAARGGSPLQRCEPIYSLHYLSARLGGSHCRINLLSK